MPGQEQLKRLYFKLLACNQVTFTGSCWLLFMEHEIELVNTDSSEPTDIQGFSLMPGVGQSIA